MATYENKRPTPALLPPFIFGPFAYRPRLTGSALAGLAAYALLFLFAGSVQWTLRVVLCWDLTCFCFIALVLWEMRVEDIASLKLKCASQDEGQGVIVALVLVAAATSLVTVGVELSAAKDDHGFFKTARVAVAGCTVALSWFMVHVIFALHYAHQYYAPDKSTEDEDDVIGGLDFPGGQDPDYWDFLHFATIIGVASQTADIAFTNRRLRHIGTVHGLISFAFNTGVLALAINLLAGLF